MNKKGAVQIAALVIVVALIALVIYALKTPSPFQAAASNGVQTSTNNVAVETCNSATDNAIKFNAVKEFAVGTAVSAANLTYKVNGQSGYTAETVSDTITRAPGDKIQAMVNYTGYQGKIVETTAQCKSAQTENVELLAYGAPTFLAVNENNAANGASAQSAIGASGSYTWQVKLSPAYKAGFRDGIICADYNASEFDKVEFLGIESQPTPSSHSLYNRTMTRSICAGPLSVLSGQPAVEFQLHVVSSAEAAAAEHDLTTALLVPTTYVKDSGAFAYGVSTSTNTLTGPVYRNDIYVS
jgi:hypothetical protein